MLESEIQSQYILMKMNEWKKTKQNKFSQWPLDHLKLNLLLMNIVTSYEYKRFDSAFEVIVTGSGSGSFF